MVITQTIIRVYPVSERIRCCLNVGPRHMYNAKKHALPCGEHEQHSKNVLDITDIVCGLVPFKSINVFYYDL